MHIFQYWVQEYRLVQSLTAFRWQETTDVKKNKVWGRVVLWHWLYSITFLAGFILTHTAVGLTLNNT